MFPTYRSLRQGLAIVIDNKGAQGHAVAGLFDTLEALPDSYDALNAFAQRLAQLPMRPDWPYVEPSDLSEIWSECDPRRPTGPVGSVNLADSAARVETAFLSSVCGCVLGKPLEVKPTLYEIRAAAEQAGVWPLRDYIPERMLEALGRRHPSWDETVRERIAFVAPDDDQNYNILGMLVLEQHGIHFTKHDVRQLWLTHLPITMTFGPERTMLLKAGIQSLDFSAEDDLEAWVQVFNPRDEFCGAVIRADAYGYACPGLPALAAELAWRDASWTHRRTGIYGAMFVAAAIACAQVMDDRLGIFETALQFVPQRSRFHQIVADCLAEVRQARDWLDGYDRIFNKYQPFDHCQIYMECGTLINTLRFAEDIADGFCKQVSQGNDTDSFGATAGSILGAFFGPRAFDARWLAPFADDLHTGMAWFFERSLRKVAGRMAALPQRTAEQIQVAM